jgi:hypothetical protein
MLISLTVSSIILWFNTAWLTNPSNQVKRELFQVSSTLPPLSTSTEIETNDTDLHRFDINKDLLVAIEIQKTGTTEYDLKIKTSFLCNKENIAWNKCCSSERKKYLKEKRIFRICHREIKDKNPIDNWYYSYHTTLKFECGLHPDFTALTHCIPKLYPNTDTRNIYYFTRLREPIDRYISEWKYISKGLPFNIKSYKTFCKIENDLCFDKDSKVKDLTLERFIKCPTNPANDRMSRMLAYYNYTEGECYGEGLEPNEMLERAKKTIDNLYYFAINEYYDESVLLFERTLSGTRSNNKKYFKFAQGSISKHDTFADKHINVLSNETIQMITNNNLLDIQLYNYALGVFMNRLKHYNIQITTTTTTAATSKTKIDENN